MTGDGFADARSRLVNEAEDTGFDTAAVLADIEAMAAAMRLRGEE